MFKAKSTEKKKVRVDNFYVFNRAKEVSVFLFKSGIKTFDFIPLPLLSSVHN